MGKVISFALYRCFGNVQESTQQDGEEVLDPYEFFKEYQDQIGLRYEDNTKGRTRLTKEALDRIRKETNERVKREYKQKISD